MTDWDGPRAPDDVHLERASGAARRKAKKVRKARAEQAAARGASAAAGGDRRPARRGPPRDASGDAGSDERPPDARRVAVEALVRIEEGGAFANLALGPALERSTLDARDRGLATELVYGTTRMRRACDWLVDRFVTGDRPLDARTRSALRLGAYQLVILGMPPHAAVTTAVSAAPKRSRGLVNAVLRKVAAEHDEHGRCFPDPATALSYPDWIVERLTEDLGPERALAALEAMNASATVTVRDDGYTQDLASQWVAELVDAGPGDRVLDLCAAPGGKATALAGTGADVVAADVRPGRVGLIAGNAARTGTSDRVHPVVADGRSTPFPAAAFDRVLVDAPCSGLGVLHRRADARWRMVPESIDRLARLQVDLVRAAADLVRPGGLLVVSVCTLTARETTGVDTVVAEVRPDLEPLPPPGDPWVPWGRGALLLPQAEGTDGMALHRYRLPG
ncbi:methyltransferase domain-containing protein [Iamia sp. SCSIO 61187]|uniref:transcription antitermination factor NusB n=1 Tax=Iamia sp. SCSIO 61187 TaxID=2722752 RepID=UPI001C6399B0|nr:transcription antitermination factor NusB [Iamia sp. SCSIO 61187]QYG93077.1 methyltransferase domain-containing protein [Iamia sp. SCSIO 61187]